MWASMNRFMNRFTKRRAMNKGCLALLMSLLALTLSVPAYAVKGQIYKWKEKNGTVRYSDTPPLGHVPYETLMGEKGMLLQPSAEGGSVDSRAVPVHTPQNVEAEKSANASKEAAEREKEKQLVEAANLKIRQQNCAEARARLHTFEQGGRISRMTEQGERVYYDDAAIAEGLAQAKKDIEAFCD